MRRVVRFEESHFLPDQPAAEGKTIRLAMLASGADFWDPQRVHGLRVVAGRFSYGVFFNVKISRVRL